MAIYNPPHCLNFDSGPTKRPHCSQFTLIPEVHVTIQNISASPTATPTSQPTGSSYLKTLSPPPSQPCTFSNLSAAPPYYGPPIQQVLNLIKANKPGQGFSKLEETLGEEGLVSLCQVVILPEYVVSVIGNMGAKKARILCNYAKH